MERKIGEIFKHNDEWYQCIEGEECSNCYFNNKKCYILRDNNNNDPIGDCCIDRRTDNKDVIFKKLEKVGEPYTHYYPSGTIIYFQRYKIFNKSYSHNTEYIMCDFNEDGIVSIGFKQNQEDMEEKRLNLKPFDLEAAKAGKPVCTRDGSKARIICFDYKSSDDYSIIALVDNGDNEIPYKFSKEGKFNPNCTDAYDLMMLPEKKEGWILLRKDGCVFDNEEVAKKNCTDDYFVAKVEWEE